MRVRRCWFHKWSGWMSAYKTAIPGGVVTSAKKVCLKCGRTKDRRYMRKEAA